MTVGSLACVTRVSATPRQRTSFAGKCSPTVSFSGGSKGTNVLLGRFRSIEVGGARVLATEGVAVGHGGTAELLRLTPAISDR